MGLVQESVLDSVSSALLDINLRFDRLAKRVSKITLS